MFSFSDVDSGLLSMPATDVAMFNERFKKISEKILMTKLSQLSTQQTEALGSLLALKWNDHNKWQVKNCTAPSCNFPHTLEGCVQILMFMYPATYVKYRAQ